MKIYLVGGAVRDQLLGLPIVERDWVVVGGTPEYMLSQGFKSVGKSFPVFLHPETQEEYALARSEKKVGHGYHGFEFFASPTVTLEEDLMRRDLTVNAIAMDDAGHWIDPFDGQADLKKKLLRHVSPAFIEDPLRVLRAARFAARFYHLGFHIADETLKLMQHIADIGELNHLTPERVWQECERALSEKHPHIFFTVLKDCGALPILFPELSRLWGIPQSEKYHPEIDTGIHTLMVLEQAAKLSPDPTVRFAALMHDLGKGLTDPSDYPHHPHHAEKGAQLVNDIYKRLRIPNAYRDLAYLVARYHGDCHNAVNLPADKQLDLLEKCDAFRKPEQLEKFLLACEADYRGRLSYENKPYAQANIIKKAYHAAKRIDVTPFIQQGLSGHAIKEALRKTRIEAITFATS